MIFMLVILKIPIVYLCAVIWWAVKAEPSPEAPSALVPAWNPELGDPSWQRASLSRLRRRPPRGPVRRPTARGTPARVYVRR